MLVNELQLLESSFERESQDSGMFILSWCHLSPGGESARFSQSMLGSHLLTRAEIR